MSEIPTSVDDILERALHDSQFEAQLRFAHRMALRRLRGPNASPDDHKRERRAWMLVLALNSRISASRLDIVDIDEEIAYLEALT